VKDDWDAETAALVLYSLFSAQKTRNLFGSSQSLSGSKLKSHGTWARQTGCLPPCVRRRSGGYGIEKSDFDADSDPDRTIS